MPTVKLQRSRSIQGSPVKPNTHTCRFQGASMAPENGDRTKREKCRTDCLERHLRIFFEMMGAFVGSHPLWFLVIPVLLSAGLGSGFAFIQDRMGDDTEEQFTSPKAPAKVEREYFWQTFPEEPNMFSLFRQNDPGIFATVIAKSDEDILTAESLQEVLDLDLKIKSIVIQFESRSFTYADICAKVMGSCVSNDVIDIIDNNAKQNVGLHVTYPWHDSGSGRIPLFLSLGSVKVDEQTSIVQSARAIMLHYHLLHDDRVTWPWMKHLIAMLSSQSSPSIQVSFTTAKSGQWELEKTPSSVIHLYAVSYVITVVFSFISCWRLDNVTNKVWVAAGGMVTTVLSIMSGLGSLLLLGQTFGMPTFISPFLILGIGLDDMFIMISGWQRTSVLDSVPTRLAHTYRDAAVSITITSLTDALALFLGCITPFGAVRSFCLYAGVSVCFCYLYNVTFLGACLALNGRREKGNRHWFTCATVPAKGSGTNSQRNRSVCARRSQNKVTERETPGFIKRLFENFYGPFLIHKRTKCLLLVIYIAYVAVSIYGCSILKHGLDKRNMALDDSYIIRFYNDEMLHFSEYGFNAMVAVKEPFRYWDQMEQERLQSCISNFQRLNYVNSTFAWFSEFQRYADNAGLTVNTQRAFQTHLMDFLEDKPLFRLDINFSANNDIQASRFYIQTIKRARDEDMMTGLRATAEECPVDLQVYHPSFIFLDQIIVLLGYTIQTIMVAAAVMLVVSLALIPSVLCSLVVVLAIFSVIAGASGFMSLWGVDLDSVAMMNLVMCVGFCVDFATHISYSFVSSRKPDANQRAVEALANTGYPVLQGAVSTILGVILISQSGCYIFTTFFKVVFLVITFGLVHAVGFIPVLLTVVRTPKTWC